MAESGVAAGIRRLEAVTGDNALAYLQSLENTLNYTANILKTPVSEFTGRVLQMVEHNRALEKELAALKSKLAAAQGDGLLAQVVNIAGTRLLSVELEGADTKTLRETMDKLKDKLKSAVIVLAAVDAGKVQLAAGVTSDLTAQIKAGELVNFVATQVGGKGGGKADMAMAGGTEPAKLTAALQSVQAWVAAKLH